MVPGCRGWRPRGRAEQPRPQAQEQGCGKRPERSGLQQSPGEALGKQEEKAGRSCQCGAIAAVADVICLEVTGQPIPSLQNEETCQRYLTHCSTGEVR